MIEYLKIETPFNRDVDGTKKLIEGSWRNEEVGEKERIAYRKGFEEGVKLANQRKTMRGPCGECKRIDTCKDKIDVRTVGDDIKYGMVVPYYVPGPDAECLVAERSNIHENGSKINSDF